MDNRRVRIVSSDDLDEQFALWASERLKAYYGLPSRDAWGPCKCAGIFRDNKLTAVAVYHGYQPYFGQVQMSLAADNPRWCNLGVLVTLLDYPFRLGLHRVWVLTRTDNGHILRLLEWIGFKREGILREFFGRDTDAISWALLDHEYEQFLREVGRDGRRRRQGKDGKSAQHGKPAEGNICL